MARSYAVLLLAALLPACSPQAPPRGIDADTLPLPVAVPAPTAELPDGVSPAGIAFGRLVTDDEVHALLRRHGVRPYQVWLMVGDAPSVHEVPAEQASLDLIAEARGVKAESARSWPCMLIARQGAMAESGRRATPAPGERDPGSRMMLARIEEARAAPARLLSGAPAIYAVKVVGSADALRALSADPLVAELTPARRDESGGWYVPGTNPPAGLGRPGNVPPSIDSLSADEVRRRLDRYASEGLPECREQIRNARVTEPTTRVENGATVGGLVFRVRARTDSLREDGTTGPTQAVAIITVTNPTARPIDLAVLGCPEGTRLYRDAARSVPALPNAGRGTRCMQDPFAVTFAPGQTREFTSGLSTDRVLGDSVAPGRYYLSATFRLRDRTLELPAGDLVLRTGREGLRYHASTALRRDTLVGRATVVNTGRAPVGLEYGACALNLRAWRTPDRSGPPAWRSEGRQPYEGGGFYGCPDILLAATLAPGDSLSQPFGVRIPVLEVLGDTLPDGRYYFSATVDLNFGATPLIPAGDVVLAARRRPLAQERLSGVMTFRARTAASAGAIRTTVTGRLSHAGGALERFAAECPVVLYAYRMRAQRNAAPREGQPAWTSHPRCGPEQHEYSFDRGATRAWTVQATAADLRRAGLPAGRYYFAVAVNHGGQRVFLLAGDAQMGG